MSENGRRRDSIFAGKPGLPRHPFRNSAVFYGVLAAIGFVFLLFTGQTAGRAAIGAGLAFVLATAWTWFRFSREQREERRREQRRSR